MAGTGSLLAYLVALRNVLIGGNLASLGLWRSPHRLVNYAGETLFLYRTLADRRGLPQKSIVEVFGSSDAARIELGCLRSGAPAAGPWFHETASYSIDLVSLCLLCQFLRPQVVFEIGTLHGYTAYHFALNTGPEARIYSLDLPPAGSVRPRLATTVVDRRHIQAERQQYCFTGTAVDSKIVCLHGDSAAFDFAPYHGRVDLFFVDGAHSYDYVRSDTLKALACCRSGSVIAWHDFGRMGINGVTRWLREFARDHEVYAVPGGSLAYMVVP